MGAEVVLAKQMLLIQVLVFFFEVTDAVLVTLQTHVLAEIPKHSSVFGVLLHIFGIVV